MWPTCRRMGRRSGKLQRGTEKAARSAESPEHFLER